jgi:O-methyltransferase involved in polyketide biosynthesis
MYTEEHRADATRSLTAHGWRVQSVTGGDEMARLGRPVPADLVQESVSSDFISAQLPSDSAL